MNPPKEDTLLELGEKPVMVDNPLHYDQNLWWRVLDEADAKFNWYHCHEGLKPQPNTSSRLLAHLLHTVIDGYTYSDDGIKIIECTIAKEVTDEINKSLAAYELVRTGLTRDLVREGHGQLSDYNHIMKVYLIGRKKMKAPSHFAEFIDKPIFTQRFDWIADRIDEIVFKLYGSDLNKPISTLVQPDAFVSKSGKGPKERDIKLIPDHITKAVKSIIEKGQSKNQAGMYSGQKESTFDSHWRKYKFIALIEYILDVTHWGFMEKDERVKQIKKTTMYEDFDGNLGSTPTYDIHVTLTEEQHRKIQVLWELKDLPNPIIVTEMRTPKEDYNYQETD